MKLIAMKTNGVVTSGILIGLLAAIVAGLAQWQFGSLSNAIDSLSGRSISIDHPVNYVGTIKGNEPIKVEFNVTNLQNETVRLAGANISCSCVVAPDMPMALEPFRATALAFTFTPPSEAGHFEQEIELYFDGPIPAMLLTISGVSQ